YRIPTEVAVFKNKFVRKAGAAKAHIRYIQNRAGKDGQKITRDLFCSDGTVTRREVYEMIDKAEKGSVFFKFVINPDSKTEDTKRDLHLQQIAEETMTAVTEAVKKP